MDIEINKNIFNDPTILEIDDNRKYQQLALLVDRDDFKEDIRKKRSTIISKYLSGPKTALEQYLPRLPKEIYDLLEKYRYPSTLANAILSLAFANKITNKEVHDYEPPIGHPKSKLRGYVSHPFDFRLDPKIKEHRLWYLTYKQNETNQQKDYLGYRQVAKIVGHRFTTVATAINTYRNKLNIIIA